jgi:hypothetical protein
MTRGTRGTSNLGRAAWIGIAVVLLVGVALQVNALVVHRRADRARDLAAAARAHDADVEDALAQSHVDLDQAVVEATAAAQALEAVRAQLVTAGTSEATIAGDVVAARSAMASLQAQIDASAADVQTRAGQLDALRGCLTAGQRALDAAAVRPGDGVDAELTAASVACAVTAWSAVAPVAGS